MKSSVCQLLTLLVLGVSVGWTPRCPAQSNTALVSNLSLGADTATRVGHGVMTYSTTLGRYTMTRANVLSNPGTVTVTSDLGATRSATVRRVNS